MTLPDPDRHFLVARPEIGQWDCSYFPRSANRIGGRSDSTMLESDLTNRSPSGSESMLAVHRTISRSNRPTQFIGWLRKMGGSVTAAYVLCTYCSAPCDIDISVPLCYPSLARNNFSFKDSCFTAVSFISLCSNYILHRNNIVWFIYTRPTFLVELLLYCTCPPEEGEMLGLVPSL